MSALTFRFRSKETRCARRFASNELKVEKVVCLFVFQERKKERKRGTKNKEWKKKNDLLAADVGDTGADANAERQPWRHLGHCRDFSPDSWTRTRFQIHWDLVERSKRPSARDRRTEVFPTFWFSLWGSISASGNMTIWHPCFYPGNWIVSSAWKRPRICWPAY